ncbi:MAG: C1 family peptidase [Aquabacterium sp.]|jgi:hypothetical protein|uniref:C1 family peptidase n=1 Tax=Aquabacterium sp. TaxID=1872578 RepID=UPI001B6E04B8|nr:C1 family peptidase [Aquabacterium sp.]MBP7133272.1 C1 family peptidase [Aquabacterium sp.]MBP9063355.1 C1 family peptidase [Aquabacterium sp.]
MPTKKVVIGQRAVSLDARPDRLDLRDRSYLPPLGNLPAQWPTDAEVKAWLPAYADGGNLLNQGSEGACTGFGLAAVINYLLFVRDLNGQVDKARRVSPAMLYQLARMYDEWPGEDYEGSSCRGALKGWHRHGVCRDQLWPYVLDAKGRRLHAIPQEDPAQPDDPDGNWDVDALACTLGVYYRVDVRSVVDMQAAIRQNGAIYVSATVHEGWGVPSRKTLRGHADLVRIKPVDQPKEAGGHAFALVGYNESGFVVQNSWGTEWGSHGFALLPYEDWVMHGTDAWVFTLGVPSQRGTSGKVSVSRSPRFLVPFGSVLSDGAPDRPAGLIAGDDALTRRFRDIKKPEHRPLDADQAYRHTIVLDRGYPVRNDITAESAHAALATAVCERPLNWLSERGSVKLMIYAHGGLNSESDAISRIRVMAPYALANGIYPLFISWRTGALETVSDMAEEWATKFGLGVRGGPRAKGWLDRITEGTDRMLEPVLRAPGGAMWGQMKLNAERASTAEQGGVRLMVPHLKALQKRLPQLEIHLIGHSAGSIVLGSMLKQLGSAGLKATSVRLFAPACTADFANRHYAEAVKKKVLESRHFHIHVLSDQNERDDAVGPYRKSLLYLVSRSFEDAHKTPLLGMQRCFDPASVAADAGDDMWARDHLKDVAQWQHFWDGLGVGATNLHVLSERRVANGAGTEAASHGCFDNAVDIIGKALGYIVDPVKQPKVRVERLAD